jgi:hypothetical protein
MQYYALSVGAILQILYIISTIGYIYRKTYERMRERILQYLLLPMQVNGAFHGIEKTCVIKAYNISVYGIDFSLD